MKLPSFPICTPTTIESPPLRLSCNTMLVTSGVANAVAGEYPM